jgi:NAD(P)H-flavin reductase
MMIENRAVPTRQSLTNGWAQTAMRITSIRKDCSQVFTYELAFVTPEAGQRYQFAPGQFNMLYVPGVGESAISIASDPGESETVLHTIRSVGNVTQSIEKLGVGGDLLMRGPFGTAWPLAQSQGKDVVIAAGGLGLAPLRSAILHCLKHADLYGHIHVLYGARSPTDILYPDELSQWSQRGANVMTTVDLGNEQWRGNIGVVPSLLSSLKLDPANTVVMTCGPEVMMRFVVFECLSKQLPPENIFVSLERSMNCAIGHCGHCQMGPVFVCKDGPVFSYAQTEAFFHVEQF